MIKKVGLLLACALVVTIYSILRPRLEKTTEIIFCDVGQGDGILIIQGDFEVVIDGGPPGDRMQSCLNRYVPVSDRSIELIISTHPDADHLGGLLPILEHYEVGTLWIEGRVTNTALYRSFLQTIRRRKEVIHDIKSPLLHQQIPLPQSGSLTVIYPLQPIGDLQLLSSEETENKLSDLTTLQNQKYGQTNDGSISVLLRIHTFSIVFTGDLDQAGELAILKHTLTDKITAIKAGHHGSKTSNSSDFLRVLSPEVLFISVGRKNRYGHPSQEVLRRVKDLGMSVYRTDLQGDIIVSVETDSGGYKVQTRE